MFKKTLSLLLIAGLFSCSSSDDDRIPVGVTVSGNSTEFAQFLADTVWCSQTRLFDESDALRENPHVEVYTLFSDGSALIQIVAEKTQNIAEELRGEWGASERTIRLVGGGEELEADVLVQANQGGFKFMQLDTGEEFNPSYIECDAIFPSN